MSQRFSYIKYDLTSISHQQAFKELFERLESLANGLLVDGRPKALLMTALEEAYMWTGKAIRDAQIARTGDMTEQKDRSDE